MNRDDTIRVFIGADRSQQLAIDVLSYSIKRHTSANVQIIPMIDLDVPLPADPRNYQRTGFSFSRFCIPKLCNYEGRAIYMDADMQVFKDIRDLWTTPFNQQYVLVQASVKHTDISLNKTNAPTSRKKQCAVMLIDCEKVDWDINKIVNDLDNNKYNYSQLMDELCIVPEDRVGYRVPFEWNSLEHFDESTCLIHYTDMGTQPWVSTRNPNGRIWFSEVRRMLKDGSLTIDKLKQEIALGYFRPSLIRDIYWSHLIPKFLKSLFNQFNEQLDNVHGYIAHRKVYEAKRLRMQAAKDYEKSLINQSI